MKDVLGRAVRLDGIRRQLNGFTRRDLRRRDQLDSDGVRSKNDQAAGRGGGASSGSLSGSSHPMVNGDREISPRRVSGVVMHGGQLALNASKGSCGPRSG